MIRKGKKGKRIDRNRIAVTAINRKTTTKINFN